MSKTDEILSRAQASLIGNYGRLPVVMDRGEGAYLWDAEGTRYIDLFAGFGGGILGHCQPDLVAAVQAQAAKLWHVGNTFHSLPQTEMAERLVKTAFPGRAFFCHSGLEANEAAIKLARLRGQSFSPKRWKVISMHRSFHGRSLATIAATGNPAIRVGFEPTVPGFTHVDLGDLEGLTAAIDAETAGVIVEPIQGEGGVHQMPLEYAIELRRICDERQITLIFDEVWTGCGRTGKWFGHQHFKRADGSVVTPDIMTMGKAVGGGLPVGVMYARPEVAALFTPGKHGCTLGGNPICMAAAKTIFDVIERDGLLGHAQTLGEHAIARLKNEPSIKQKIQQVRGKGLFIGIELKEPPTGIVERGIANGVLINLTSQKVVRLAPPMNIDIDTWNQGLDLVVKTIAAG
ncbi:aspartate aminotransferase family protein [Humisphaera borealis]|uniref:Acetylornithine/succinylornithine family transaminase n=1 Tax=Humisphaera borealis TaxID=2807512 RepID=A0A7M2X1W3_9BACT|nr:acetylornithine/succinylornithine family transaminase [Humisphaera borealis]QOV91121.1 acetylornithine/succinylornithine family transaminase [Humisphaera borealis]